MNTTEIMAILLTAVLSYLLGSISFAVIVSRLLAHDDVRKYGSHNAGMTNVLRVYGKGPAALTLVGDFGKGVAAVFLGRLLFQAMGVTLFDAGYLAGLCVLLGHLFPVFFGFKGGKGVLTSMGITLAVNPVVLLILLVILLPVLFVVKIVSLIAITNSATSHPCLIQSLTLSFPSLSFICTGKISNGCSMAQKSASAKRRKGKNKGTSSKPPQKAKELIKK